MRLISFALTRDQVRAKTKTQTRRIGWEHVRVGDRLRGVLKVQGRRIGEPLIDLAVVEVTEVRREVLGEISAEDLDREGFPAQLGDDLDERRRRFVALFPVDEREVVTVIGFRYLDDEIMTRVRAGEYSDQVAAWLDRVESRFAPGTVEAVHAVIRRARPQNGGGHVD